MVVAVETVAIRYEDIVAGTPISVPYPLYEATDITVYYGSASLVAVYNTDYTIALGDDFDTFTLVPMTSLLNKINALIAADPTEENYITVRRELDYKTDTTDAAVRYTPFTSREFDRTALRFQQLNDALRRTIQFPPNVLAGDVSPYLTDLEGGDYLRLADDGSRFVGSPLGAVFTEVAAWFNDRSAGSASAAVSQGDGLVVSLAGRKYIVDTDATGALSSVYDLGVDGLSPFPRDYLTPDMFGDPALSDNTLALLRCRDAAERTGQAMLINGDYTARETLEILQDGFGLHFMPNTSIAGLAGFVGDAL